MVMSILFMISACEDYLDEEFKSGLSPANFYNSDSEAQIAVDGAYSMLTSNGWFKHRDRKAWWQIAADEISSTRNIFKEAHNITYNEGVMVSVIGILFTKLLEILVMQLLILKETKIYHRLLLKNL